MASIVSQATSALIWNFFDAFIIVVFTKVEFECLVVML